MRLKVKDVAKLLHLSEKTIYRMVQSETIPCMKVGGQWRFNKEEILGWIEDAKDVAHTIDQKANMPLDEEKINIPTLLRKGGIYYRVEGATKEEVIRESLLLIHSGMKQKEIDLICYSALEREQLCSTAIGHGIAIPHPPYLKGYANPISSISLCFLDSPVSFSAMDGKDVTILFFISPRNEVRYLRLQSKLMGFLRENEICSTLEERPLRNEIMSLFSDNENGH